MNSQLPRQLELNVTALCRGFRQALRFAQKSDPQGTSETSAAWRAAAARQEMLLTMLQAVGQFFHPAEPAPDAVDAPAIEATNEAPPSENEGVAPLPEDMQALREEIIDLSRRPTHNRQERRRREREILRLQVNFQKRFDQWKAQRTGMMGQFLPAGSS